MNAMRFVADGFSRLWSSPEFRGRRDAIERQVRAEYAGELAGKPYWKRVAIRFAISREIRRRVREILASVHTCWSCLTLSPKRDTRPSAEQ
jgi:hypothetical protein